MTSNYIELNADFINALPPGGYIVGINQFAYAQTTGGVYVCSENSLEEFPELFANTPYLPYIFVTQLSNSDFPAPQPTF